MYRGFLVDKELVAKDVHFRMGCKYCHQGDDKGRTKNSAHKGMIKRPSSNLQTCGGCHKDIANNFKKSLHYTTIGLRQGVMKRFSAAELKQFDEKVFEQSCRSCHASCGSCHVKSPPVGGISTGLLKGHQFVRRDEERTCSTCHGGRVYPEFTGDYGGNPNVHYQSGMTCVSCHPKQQMHGDGNAYLSKNDVKNRPSCKNCHTPGKEKSATARISHQNHEGKVSCYGCHSAGEYRNCYDCHIETHSHSKPGFILGLNPRDMKTVTTLRVVPTVRNTFKAAGIKMENFDALTNYWDAAAHNIRKKTERTASCDVCHTQAKGFLTKEQLLKDGSKANEALIVRPQPLKR